VRFIFFGGILPVAPRSVAKCQAATDLRNKQRNHLRFSAESAANPDGSGSGSVPRLASRTDLWHAQD